MNSSLGVTWEVANRLKCFISTLKMNENDILSNTFKIVVGVCIYCRVAGSISISPFNQSGGRNGKTNVL